MIEPDDRSRWHRVVWWALVASPLVVAAAVLLWRPWAPTLDMAMTELRVRDVGGRHTPLIGLPGRIGDFPDQGSHPGPWSFYLMAPFYWLSGRRAWGLEFGSAMVNAAAIGVIVWLGHRVDRRWGAVVAAAVRSILERSQTPLYGCAADNIRSQRTALSVGFLPILTEAGVS